MEKIYNINDIITANRVRGFYFFDKDTMRFFASRVQEEVFQGPGGVYFITSEKFKSSHGGGPRRFTVRQFNPETGDVSTVGEFNTMTKAKAVKEAKRLAGVES